MNQSIAHEMRCPSGAIPADLPIQQNIAYVVVPGRNQSRWMTNCCQPQPVNLVNTCWEWCQMPGRLASQGDHVAQREFRNCLYANDRDLRVSNAILFHSSAQRPWGIETGAILILVVLLAHTTLRCIY